jgi:CRISPR type III-A-associated protein Csm2
MTHPGGRDQRRTNPGYQGNRAPAAGGTQTQSPGGGPVNAAISPDEARRIVKDGDVELLVRKARESAQEAEKGHVTQTSVRRLFGEARRIELLWSQATVLARSPDRADEDQEIRRLAARRSVLLRPRLQYQVARNSNLRVVQSTLDPLLLEVGGDPAAYKHFVEFFEAFVAYLKAR